MEEHQEPFPTMLFVNEAFRRAKALESPETKIEIKQEDYQRGEFKLQNFTPGVKTEGCELGNSWSGYSNEGRAVELKNEYNEVDHTLINDSSQVKCESDAQIDTDSLVSNEDRVDIVEIKLERDEEQDDSFNSTGHATNARLDQVTSYDHQMSTELYSNKQEELDDCKRDEVKKDLWENNDTGRASTSTRNCDERNDSERTHEFHQKMGFQVGNEMEKFTENVALNENVNYTCTYSVKAFNHNVDHTVEKPYKCTICDKEFTVNSTLARHMRLHTGEKPYECTVCHKAFMGNFDLTKHMRFHTGEKPFKCTVCDKVFASKCNLTTHMRHHTGEKPFACTVCDKAFTISSNLARHIRLHTGEKPYKCAVCDKAFTGDSDLTKHMRIHTGEKPFKCTVCDKAFSVSSSLTKHMRHHTGEKPFECSVCDKAFTNNSNLTRHIMRCHSGENPYK